MKRLKIDVVIYNEDYDILIEYLDNNVLDYEITEEYED